MRIYILSDLHLEFAPFKPPELDVDVVVLAGDIHVENGGVQWVNTHFKNTPVIYILGNHEYYGSAMLEHLSALKELTRDSNIHVLENESISFNDVQFLCCTLWTDFNLLGNAQSGKNMSTRYISDYEMIKFGDSHRNVKSSDILKQHKHSLTWLKKEIKTKPIHKRVIVTHHAPSQKSLPTNFVNDEISPAYASRLDTTVLQSNADIWIHGHIHTSKDYMIGKTRIICNPRGYPDMANEEFISNLVIDL